MQPSSEPARATRRIASLHPLELAALLLVIAIYLVIRLPLFSSTALVRGWNSDAAIYLLMGKRMAMGEDFPVYYWGQSYMGPLTSISMAVTGIVLRAARLDDFGPLTARLSGTLFVLAGLLFHWVAIRRIFGPLVALVAFLWLSVGPRNLFHTSVVPLGSEMVVVVSGVLLYLAARFFGPDGKELRSGWEQFVFGLVAGFGWWMNQGTIFVTAAVVWALIARSEWYRRFRTAIRPADRLLVRWDRLGWRPVDPPLRWLLVSVQMVLTALLVHALARLVHLGPPRYYVAYPLLEPLGGLILFALLCEVVFRKRSCRRVFPVEDIVHAFREWTPLLLGAALGALPVVLGGPLGWYPKQYGLSTPLRPLQDVAPQLGNIIARELWRFLGIAPTVAGWIFAAAAVAGLSWRLWRARADVKRILTAAPGVLGIREIGGVTVLAASIFFLFSSRAHEGSVRYVVAALPIVYAFLADTLVGMAASARPYLRGIAILCIVMAVVSLATVSMATAREIESEPDPMPLIDRIISSGYSICHAEYWTAYKLQFLSRERIRFIPYRSFDRNRTESASLTAEPGPKCLVDRHGQLREYRFSDAERPISDQARKRRHRKED
ncbi:MAG TPA: hypothetical protein VMT00_10550 [Thermoanaerobaculia bacterium]|nr:hypothetical protein [Thermoanaerobaculia bacterium]